MKAPVRNVVRGGRPKTANDQITRTQNQRRTEYAQHQNDRRRCDEPLTDGNFLPPAFTFIDDEFDGENESDHAEDAQNAAARTGHQRRYAHPRESASNEATA